MSGMFRLLIHSPTSFSLSNNHHIHHHHHGTTQTHRSRSLPANPIQQTDRRILRPCPPLQNLIARLRRQSMGPSQPRRRPATSPDTRSSPGYPARSVAWDSSCGEGCYSYEGCLLPYFLPTYLIGLDCFANSVDMPTEHNSPLYKDSHVAVDAAAVATLRAAGALIFGILSKSPLLFGWLVWYGMLTKQEKQQPPNSPPWSSGPKRGTRIRYLTQTPLIMLGFAHQAAQVPAPQPP